MISIERRPPPHLRSLVTCFWTIETPTESRHCVVPDNAVDIIFRYGEGRDRSWEGGRVIGMMSRPLEIPLPPGARFVGIRLEPWALATIFRLRASEITDGAIPLDLLWKSGAHELEARTAETSSPAAAFAVLEQRLGARLRGLDLEIPSPARRAAEILRRSRGQLSIEELSRGLGMTRQALTRRFSRELGLSPKLFARVERFQSLLAGREPSRGWADLAAEHGYFDQSHLVAEFRALTGKSPGRFHFSNPVRT